MNVTIRTYRKKGKGKKVGVEGSLGDYFSKPKVSSLFGKGLPHNSDSIIYEDSRALRENAFLVEVFQ